MQRKNLILKYLRSFVEHKNHVLYELKYLRSFVEHKNHVLYEFPKHQIIFELYEFYPRKHITF